MIPIPVGVAATAAYRAAQALPQVGQAAGEAVGSFGAALGRALESVVSTGRSADAASNQALTGDGSVTDVMLAVSRAELSLQTAVAVRDRVVAAYQEIARMPI